MTAAIPAAAATSTVAPSYLAGRWAIDPVHSDVSFVIRHMMVSKVRGQFGTFSGEIVTAADPLQSTVTATLDVGSVNTGNEGRDAHLRSPDFFDTDANGTAEFRSTSIRAAGDDLVVTGDLTLKGVTRPVELTLEVNGIGPDPQGGTRAGFSGRATINRSDFNVGTSAVANSVVVLSDNVDLLVEVEAVLQPGG